MTARVRLAPLLATLLTACGSPGDGGTASSAATSEPGTTSSGPPATSSTTANTPTTTDASATGSATDAMTSAPTTGTTTAAGPTTDLTSTTVDLTTTGDPSTTTTGNDPGTTTTGDPDTSTTSTTNTTNMTGGDPPPPPAMPKGCTNVCECCEPWPISWADVPGATHYVVRWKCSINPEQVIDVGDVNMIGDVCNDIDMCNGMCAFTVGYIKVEACNADGCSMAVNFPVDEIPISCGGGCCC
jgi:hypothetical protein